MTLPMIHMNGTSAGMLLEGYRSAMDAVQDAITALSRIEFNARDYYPLGPDAWTSALEEMTERHRKLQGIYHDLLAIAKHVMDAGNI